MIKKTSLVPTQSSLIIMACPRIVDKSWLNWSYPDDMMIRRRTVTMVVKVKMSYDDNSDGKDYDDDTGGGCGGRRSRISL